MVKELSDQSCSHRQCVWQDGAMQSQSSAPTDERHTIPPTLVSSPSTEDSRIGAQLSNFPSYCVHQGFKLTWNGTPTLGNGIAISTACLRDALQSRPNKCLSEGRLRRRPSALVGLIGSSPADAY